MAARNYLARDNGTMNPVLLRPAPMNTALAWGGQRVVFDLPVYLQALPGPAQQYRDDPLYICIATSFTIREDGINRASRHIQTVVQLCALGYPEALLNPDLPSLLIRMRDELRARYAQFPDGALAELRGPEGVPWMAAELPQGDEAVPTIAQVHRCVIAFMGDGSTEKASVIRILAHGLLAYCKQGTVTNNVLNKITMGIRDSLGFTVNLDSDTVRNVWNIVSPWMTPDVAAHFLRTWEQTMGPHCLRLRLLVQQASWAGMTNYQNILKAQAQFPNFNWAGLASIIGGDFRAFELAKRAVRGNPYYGYSRDLGDAKATLYPNLAYAAYQLLRDIHGDRDLSDFQGVNRRVPHAASIDTMINNFRAQRAANDLEGINNPTEENLETARLFLRPPPVGGDDRAQPLQ